jgi:hypothetical protein
MSIQEEFKKWMPKNGIKKSVYNYARAINKISKHYSKKTEKGVDIYKITDLIELRNICTEYDRNGSYQDFGDEDHGLYRAAIKAYVKFIESNNGEPIPPRPNPIPTGQEFEFINKAHMIILPVLSFMIILPILSKYIGRILLKRKENNWWKKYILDKLRDTRDLPQNGANEDYINELDISACLNIIIQNWDDIFKHEMDIHSRDLAFSLLGIRNKEGAHYSTKILSKYSYDDVNYALNTIIHFMRPIDPNVAEQISEIKEEFEKKYKK